MEITAFGEELDRHTFLPNAPGVDEEMLTDYTRALDAYEEAKREMASEYGDRSERALEAVADGRAALARLDARIDGRPLPPVPTPCFFDSRHGTATDEVEWTPDGGAPRKVPSAPPTPSASPKASHRFGQVALGAPPGRLFTRRPRPPRPPSPRSTTGRVTALLW
ncbi:hypothetical protein GCM10009780_60710 [Actinomadura alba]